ncbi:MAG TPA: hypothetical protein PKK23_10615 [Nitrospirales bacterium]|nr:hypothetical protein [Nitrospiraceae bacterium]HNP29490.1 hypothetical protein [Nitrospirales bacterium]
MRSPGKTSRKGVFLFLSLVILEFFFLHGPAFSQEPATPPPTLQQSSETTSPSPSTPPVSSPTAQPVTPTVPQEVPQVSADSEEESEREVTRIPLVGVERGGVLLQKDQLVLEPALTYTFGTNTRLIVSGFSVLPLIVLGDLESEKTTSQTTTPALGFRYGLMRGLQIDGRLPLVYQTITRLRVSTETTGQVEESSEEWGIGDISFALSYQFLYEQGWYPDMVVRIGATAPTGRSQFDIFENIAARGPISNVEEFLTRLNDEGAALGTGRWFIDTSISGVKALDPAILFGSLGYSYSPPVSETLIRITANAVGEGIALIPEPIQAGLGPVNQISQNLGMAIALNNRVSMNFSFSNLVRFATKVDGQKVPDSNIHVSTLNMGFNVAITSQVTTNVSGAIGLTPDAPDFAFTLTTPISITHPFDRSIKWLSSLFSTSAPPPEGQEPTAQ